MAICWRFPKGMGGIYIGRDYYARRDCCVHFSLGALKDAQEGEIPYRLDVSLSWNWLPDRIWRRELPAWAGIPSSLWTGREVTFVKFGPWSRSFYWIFR